MGPDDFNNFLIVSDKNGGILDLLKFLVFNDHESGTKFLETFDNDCGSLQEKILGDDHGGGGGDGGGGEVTRDHRWVIVVSILVRKIIKVFGKPMEWAGYVVEFFLNLFSLNGNFLGLINRIIHGITLYSAQFYLFFVWLEMLMIVMGRY